MPRCGSRAHKGQHTRHMVCSLSPRQHFATPRRLRLCCITSIQARCATPFASGPPCVFFVALQCALAAVTLQAGLTLTAAVFGCLLRCHRLGGMAGRSQEPKAFDHTAPRRAHTHRVALVDARLAIRSTSGPAHIFFIAPQGGITAAFVVRAILAHFGAAVPEQSRLVTGQSIMICFRAALYSLGMALPRSWRGGVVHHGDAAPWGLVLLRFTPVHLAWLAAVSACCPA
mmetsp:Transcript_93638/g.200841  ORF Transcript_93638/g.200841 Transcript_93638/m.200841 type:complete len:229 (+) Transcript_93638:826-1512(+)